MMLERSFYERDTLTVAQDLLNCILVHKSPESTTEGRVVETEAYLGPEDKAAHSYGGRRTPVWTRSLKGADLPTSTSCMAITTALTW